MSSSSKTQSQAPPVPSRVARDKVTAANGASRKVKRAGPPPEKEDPQMIGPWKMGKTIGKGSSGRVKLARHVQTRQLAAVKIVPKHVLLSSRMSISEAGAKADKAQLGIEREIVIMKLIEHPNVLRLYDVWETGSELFLIMEYVSGGELFEYLVKRGRLHADEALGYFQQIIAGVDYCHRFNICHRDLKPENLLLDENRNIKIADFGMAALERNDKLLETSCGSPHYASPEIVAGLTYHGSSSDIWSCGIILFALLTGRLPFDDENIRTLLAKVKVGKFNMPPELPTDAQNLIRRMLEVDPAKRITMEQIQAHPWFNRIPPKKLGGIIIPPTPDQISRPVHTRAEIDLDILSNLRTLWYGTDEETIVEALLSKEKSWHKVFYYLLLKYRSRHMDGSEASSPTVEAPPATTKSSISRSQRSTASLSDLAMPPPAPTERQKQSTPPRLQSIPPTPPSKSPGPSKVRPLPDAPMLPPPTPTIPSIQLQTSTPERPDRSDRTVSMSSDRSRPAPPSPTGSYTYSPNAAPLLPIQIPQTGDAAMQRFFHDIVDQLQTMSMQTQSLPGTPASSHRSSFLSSPATSAPGSSATPEIKQFADACFEDAADDTSQASVSPRIGVSPQASPNLSYDRPASPNGMSSRQPISYAPSLRPNRDANPVRPAMLRPNSAFVAPTSPPVSVPRRGASTRSNGSDKENAHGPRAYHQPGNNKRATLGLAIQSAGVPASAEYDEKTRLKKKRSSASPAASPRIPSGDSNGSAPQKGRSWFATLFNWKKSKNDWSESPTMHSPMGDGMRLLPTPMPSPAVDQRLLF